MCAGKVGVRVLLTIYLLCLQRCSDLLQTLTSTTLHSNGRNEGDEGHEGHEEGHEGKEGCSSTCRTKGHEEVSKEVTTLTSATSD